MSIHARHISYRRGSRYLLREVSLTLSPGRMLAVVGANGAGKSTLLKVLSGELPATGEVRLEAHPLASFSARELALHRAVLPQQGQVHFPYTVREVVHLGRQPHRTARQEDEQVVQQVMALTDTLPFADRHYQSLSGGEQQRVQLARVLAQVYPPQPHPRYILLDEPTASLDLAQQHHVLSRVRQACTHQIGVLAIVHDLNLAAAYADELLLLKAGRVVAYGPTAEVLQAHWIEQTFDHPVRLLYEAGQPLPFIVPVSSSIASLHHTPHS
ncbi:iron complex transport system ATP-binding protein [Catalinimonas alkaloidigena]|uniref:Iron complex transport system ATP-binding protein n=1 Tax=Catalinimonas alkaloidigena TaxID=1075417 RepID=A0A1G9KE62_9BACT|nr:heme ABC transporter ATP-binding protein [Catalinimonas alkaloidigena]SDL47744.1 iron complex transport system ATP-binding protein [Catalinimonas alkaloidigena]